MAPVLLVVLAVAPVVVVVVAVVQPRNMENQQYAGVQAVVVAELCREPEARVLLEAVEPVVGLAAAVQRQIT
jgi:hypothetical protein